ncbi:Glutamyl-tRNA(Gln) amidotransferase subunit A [Labeo rohita]|uniref:Glutamyl-tRNA(Gln) amidotransferase subunit A n=1 Tax=Labeo rohita TaxID=84645 RepID=A0ABQ8MF83_LABRO|nr:Glutamyl-tRNA(Gln) amidotransferase subunit A [Labeo rohita]
MDFKPEKPRSLVLRKGNVTDKFRFCLRGLQIPSITEKQVKSLGKVFKSTLKDTATLRVAHLDYCSGQYFPGFESMYLIFKYFQEAWEPYDVLPSPTNLFAWSLKDTPACLLCQKRGSLEHILSCCPKALGERRYRWRHDQAGEKPSGSRNLAGGLLATARDWQLKVDLGKQLKIPETIATTTLRPDMVLFSESSRQMVLLELTKPWKDRMEESFKRKRAKHEELASECRNRGWKTCCFPIEVGCQGFASQLLCRALKLLGMRGLHKNKAIRNIMDAAEKASRWLWINRADPWTTQAT